MGLLKKGNFSTILHDRTRTYASAQQIARYYMIGLITYASAQQIATEIR